MIANKVKRIIFAAGNGISRAPMAMMIMKKLIGEDSGVEILSRGIIVQFPEPLNQKTEAVMISNGINLTDFTSRELSNEDITEETLIFTMDRKQWKEITDQVEKATPENTFVLNEYLGEELEIMDPYGGTLATYGLCFEALKESVRKLSVKLGLVTEQEAPSEV